MTRLLFIFLAALGGPTFNTKSIHILFVGNSLTYTNDLPSQVKGLAREEGLELTIKTLAYPNYALEDHWNDGELQQLIKSKQYAFVIVQQGPSSQQDGRSMLFEYGEKINTLCKANNARLGFYMVWPARANYSTFEGVIKNYTDAATQFEAMLFPVGEVWKNHMDKSHDYSYYGIDNFHPSLEGTRVAAEMITRILLAAVNE